MRPGALHFPYFQSKTHIGLLSLNSSDENIHKTNGAARISTPAAIRITPGIHIPRFLVTAPETVSAIHAISINPPRTLKTTSINPTLIFESAPPQS
jgi:hypothetical protein